MKPIRLGAGLLPDEILKKDKKNCRKIGPCGIGEMALYLNSFYVERRYYVPIARVSRVFKRVAMSKGGFSGKGMFATIPYLVVVYDNGKEKQCNFKFEEQVDEFLGELRRTHPEIRLVSEAAEARLAERERERAARKLPVIPEPVKQEIQRLEAAKAYLNEKPELADEMSIAARRKRSFEYSSPTYRYVALCITLMGLAAFAYGVISLLNHSNSFAIYFTLFGLGAIALFSGLSVLPTAQNNRRTVCQREERANHAVEDYVKMYPAGAFPVPARYAHPVVLDRMIRMLEEGSAADIGSALEAVKADLKRLNHDVEVDQEEYDEVVAIKSMFLNADYC
jgi:hypothetical protein